MLFTKGNDVKKLITVAAVAALAMGSSPAFAADATYTLTATVSSSCSVSAGTTLAFGNLESTPGTFSPATATPSRTDSAAYCNQAGTTVDIAATPLATTNAAGTGFTNTLVVTPTITTPQGVTLNAGTAQAIGSFTGMTIAATLTSPTSKLVSGTYAGSITITLHPAA